MKSSVRILCPKHDKNIFSYTTIIKLFITDQSEVSVHLQDGKGPQKSDLLYSICFMSNS